MQALGLEPCLLSQATLGMPFQAGSTVWMIGFFSPCAMVGSRPIKDKEVKGSTKPLHFLRITLNPPLKFGWRDPRCAFHFWVVSLESFKSWPIGCKPVDKNQESFFCLVPVWRERNVIALYNEAFLVQGMKKVFYLFFLVLV